MNIIRRPSNIDAIRKLCIKSPDQSFVHRRWLAGNSTTSATVDRQRKKDGVDDRFQLIYKPPNSQLLVTATSFSFLGAFTCPSFLLQYTFDRFYGDNMELVEQVSEIQLGIMGTAAVASMFTLHLCRSIPFRIYSHQKEYIAILPSAIPFLTRKLHFVKGDIKDKNSSGWGRKLLEKILEPGFETASFYKIKGTRVLLTIKCFETPIQFYEMFPNTAKYARKIKQLGTAKQVK